MNQKADKYVAKLKWRDKEFEVEVERGNLLPSLIVLEVVGMNGLFDCGCYNRLFRQGSEGDGHFSRFRWFMLGPRLRTSVK